MALLPELPCIQCHSGGSAAAHPYVSAVLANDSIHCHLITYILDASDLVVYCILWKNHGKKSQMSVTLMCRSQDKMFTRVPLKTIEHLRNSSIEWYRSRSPFYFPAHRSAPRFSNSLSICSRLS